MKDCPLILVPAYGAKYNSATDALHAYQTGKDFKILGGPYTSVRDEKLLVAQFGDIYIRWTLNQYVEVNQ